MIPAANLMLIVGTRQYAVASFEQASLMFRMARDCLNEGAGATPVIEIADAKGTTIAHISYNDRVWCGSGDS